MDLERDTVAPIPFEMKPVLRLEGAVKDHKNGERVFINLRGDHRTDDLESATFLRTTGPAYCIVQVDGESKTRVVHKTRVIESESAMLPMAKAFIAKVASLVEQVKQMPANEQQVFLERMRAKAHCTPIGLLSALINRGLKS